MWRLRTTADRRGEEDSDERLLVFSESGTGPAFLASEESRAWGRVLCLLLKPEGTGKVGLAALFWMPLPLVNQRPQSLLSFRSVASDWEICCLSPHHNAVECLLLLSTAPKWLRDGPRNEKCFQATLEPPLPRTCRLGVLVFTNLVLVLGYYWRGQTSTNPCIIMEHDVTCD